MNQTNKVTEEVTSSTLFLNGSDVWEAAAC